jgi:hypothetical protein
MFSSTVNGANPHRLHCFVASRLRCLTDRERPERVTLEILMSLTNPQMCSRTTMWIVVDDDTARGGKARIS